MKGLILQINEKTMIQKQASDYVVAIYCKLSKDDGLDGDSSSIQNQKETLIKYCNDNNYLVGGIYCDDGYSGTNFNRPDFIRMIDDIKEEKSIVLLQRIYHVLEEIIFKLDIIKKNSFHLIMLDILRLTIMLIVIMITTIL